MDDSPAADPRPVSARPAAVDRAAGHLAAVAALSARLSASDVDRPTLLPGWTVAQLLDHVGHGARLLADRLLAYLPADAGARESDAGGDPGAGRVAAHDAGPSATGTPGPARLAASITDAAAALRRAGDRIASVPSSSTAAVYGRSAMPLSMLCDIVDFEFATHALDVNWALGAPTPLDEHATAAAMRVFGGALHRLGGAGEPPHEPIRFDLAATDDDYTAVVTYRDGRWTADPDPDVATVRITAPAHALALLVLGRIAAPDPWLDVDGPAAHAAAFTRYFPGPS